MPWKSAKHGGHTKAGQKRGGYVRNTKQYEVLKTKVGKREAAAIANSSKHNGRTASGKIKKK